MGPLQLLGCVCVTGLATAASATVVGVLAVLQHVIQRLLAGTCTAATAGVAVLCEPAVAAFWHIVEQLLA
jgi:hypothetical protein